MDDDSIRRREGHFQDANELNWWMCILQSFVVFNTALIKYMYETAKGKYSRLEG